MATWPDEIKNTGINVTIHNVNDRLFFTVPLNKSTSIRYIKNLFCESVYETYNIEDICAWVDPYLADDNKTLSDYDITNDNITINMVTSLK